MKDWTKSENGKTRRYAIWKNKNMPIDPMYMPLKKRGPHTTCTNPRAYWCAEISIRMGIRQYDAYSSMVKWNRNGENPNIPIWY